MFSSLFVLLLLASSSQLGLAFSEDEIISGVDAENPDNINFRDGDDILAYNAFNFRAFDEVGKIPVSTPKSQQQSSKSSDDYDDEDETVQREMLPPASQDSKDTIVKDRRFFQHFYPNPPASQDVEPPASKQVDPPAIQKKAEDREVPPQAKKSDNYLWKTFLGLVGVMVMIGAAVGAYRYSGGRWNKSDEESSGVSESRYSSFKDRTSKHSTI